MKNNNKSWIRQLSESYIRQALNENDMHQIIDAAHARTVPAHKGQVKAFLDAHVTKTGNPLDHEGAVQLVVDRFVDGNRDWEAAVGETGGQAVGDYSDYNAERYMNNLLKNTK